MWSTFIYQYGCFRLVWSTLLQLGRCSSIHDAIPCIISGVFFTQLSELSMSTLQTNHPKENSHGLLPKGKHGVWEATRWPTLTSWLDLVWVWRFALDFEDFGWSVCVCVCPPAFRIFYCEARFHDWGFGISLGFVSTSGSANFVFSVFRFDLYMRNSTTV